MKCLLILGSTFCITINCFAQLPNYLWAHHISDENNEESYSCATDVNSNIITTGYFSTDTLFVGPYILINSGSNDIFIIKYDSSGNVLWAKSQGGISGDQALSCATDLNGNIIITGYFWSDTLIFGSSVLIKEGIEDIFIAKYDPNGNVLWAKSQGWIYNDRGQDCATDASGNIFLTGVFTDSITFGSTVLTGAGNYDIFVVKYDPSGNILWSRSAGGNAPDVPNGCATDAVGNIIVTGEFNSPSITFGSTVLSGAGNSDVFVVKYDGNGNVLWAKSAGGTSIDKSNCCATDADGNVFAAGRFNSASITFGTSVLTNAGNADMFTVKYDSGGNVLWAISSGGTGADVINSCATDAAGNVVVAGFFQSSAINIGTTVLGNTGLSDILIVEYDSTGNVLWAKSAGGSNLDVANSCVTDASGNIICSGYFQGDTLHFGAFELMHYNLKDFFIMKLDNGTVQGVHDIVNNKSPVTIVPNPASSGFTVDLPNGINKAEIKITDVNGKIIYATVANSGTAEVNACNFENGIYLVQVQTNNFISIAKLMIAK